VPMVLGVGCCASGRSHPGRELLCPTYA
jgi:hypothetical protein